jgi:hypothetical protein
MWVCHSFPASKNARSFLGKSEAKCFDNFLEQFRRQTKTKVGQITDETRGPSRQLNYF